MSEHGCSGLGELALESRTQRRHPRGTVVCHGTIRRGRMIPATLRDHSGRHRNRRRTVSGAIVSCRTVRPFRTRRVHQSACDRSRSNQLEEEHTEPRDCHRTWEGTSVPSGVNEHTFIQSHVSIQRLRRGSLLAAPLQSGLPYVNRPNSLCYATELSKTTIVASPPPV